MLSTLTPGSIETALSEHEWQIEREGWQGRTYTSEYEGWYGWDECFDYSDTAPVPVTIDGMEVTVRRVGDTYTGGEGGGEDIEMIFEVTDGTGTRYFRKTGYYQSYDGSNWDGSFDEVKPAQKYVTVYEAL